MDKKTHIYCTDFSLNQILLQKQFTDHNIKKYTNGIVFYANQPDVDEKDGLFKYHFFNPATRKNFLGERDSAFTRCINNYRNSVFSYYIKYESDNCQKIRTIKFFYEYLGRCLHYLQDINTPVHVFYEDFLDAGFNSYKHLKFEEYCDKICESDPVEFNPYYINLDYYLHNDIKNIIKHCVAISSQLMFEYLDDEKKLDDVCRKSIYNCIVNTYGIIYKFLNEGRNDNA